MGQLSVEELREWLRPAEALARLPSEWDQDRKQRVIVKRLAMGDIKAGALTGRYWRGRAAPQEERNCIIPAHLWSPEWNLRDHDLWTVGDVSFDDEEPPQMVFIVGPDTFDEPPKPVQHSVFTGVRFEPTSFATAFDLPRIAPAESGQEDAEGGSKTPLSAAEMTRFARLYLELWSDNAREMKALDAIRAAYPDHSIGRDPFLEKFRELRGPGKRGKPVIRGK